MAVSSGFDFFFYSMFQCFFSIDFFFPFLKGLQKGNMCCCICSRSLFCQSQ